MLPSAVVGALTFTTLWANLADNKLVIFFLFFPENRIWHFMQIVSIGDNLHEMSKLFSGKKNKKNISMLSAENIEKYFNVVCWKY